MRYPVGPWGAPWSLGCSVDPRDALLALGVPHGLCGAPVVPGMPCWSLGCPTVPGVLRWCRAGAPDRGPHGTRRQVGAVAFSMPCREEKEVGPIFGVWHLIRARFLRGRGGGRWWLESALRFLVAPSPPMALGLWLLGPRGGSFCSVPPAGSWILLVPTNEGCVCTSAALLKVIAVRGAELPDGRCWCALS